MKVAVVGSGISGLAAAHVLRGAVDVTLFEAGSYFGGHTNTVEVTLPTPRGYVSHGVDTGFLVFNERTYPQLIKLFAELGVVTVKSDMSFSVKSLNLRNGRPLEWGGSSLNSLFAQRSNLVSWRFWNMLRDILKFNALCTKLAKDEGNSNLRQTLGAFLKEHRFGVEFCEGYFLPMAACIWSCPTEKMLEFPVATMIRFCHNHGLIQATNRPQWWTVQGGAKHYVEKITADIADKRLNTPVRLIERAGDANGGRVKISTDHTQEHFDAVVIATHSDDALALLKEPTALESTLLSAIKYHPNRAVLHTDSSVLPTRRAAWAAWNYERAQSSVPTQSADSPTNRSDVCLHYLINRLQPLPFEQPVIVSLNPLRDIPAKQVLAEFDYAHPVFDSAAIKAQRQLPWLQGQKNTYFCGAWSGYGFHEDGLTSGQTAATQLLSHHGRAPQ